MEIEFLGTGGAITTPRPGCGCRVCVEARAKGAPYSRTGPCLFVHGPDVLFDTPEEIKYQLNRSQVTRIAGCFYSHWHPDHTMGRRVWEARNREWREHPPRSTPTDIYLPQQVAADFRRWLATWDHLSYLEQLGTVRRITLTDGECVTLGATTIRPFRLAEDYVYAFILEEAGKRVLIAPDELHGWTPPPEVRGLDAAVIPMGLTEFNPLTGARVLHPDHFLLKVEATFEQTLEIARQLDARRVFMTHIEEPDELSYDDLLELETVLRRQGLEITFAYDTLRVTVK